MAASFLKIYYNESSDDADKKWMNAHVDDSRLKTLIPKLSVLALHALGVIEKNGKVRGIDIACELGVTKGAISKVTKKLWTYGLIEKEKRPANNKDIYFSVTPIGEKLSQLHDKFHREMDKKNLKLLKEYDQPELELIADFLEKLAKLR